MQTDRVAHDGLRLLVYDADAGGLSFAWATGARWYRARGWLDRAKGAESWEEALEFLETTVPSRKVSEIQFWGHGKWGDARFGDERLELASLARGHPHGERLRRVAARFDAGAVLWFRSCETLGASSGQAFAQALAGELGCTVAGHTYVIDLLQSGLHALRPGGAPDWDPEEGLAEGSAERPLRALRSSPSAPRTITCFDGRLPDWA